jgi:adenylate cyclase
VRVRSFQTRVVALFVGLVTVVQLVGFVVVSLAITRNARAQIGDELAVGAKVFGRLIGARTRHLAEAARLLAGDFAFKTAVSAEDRATVLSVLENHQARIGADVMMLTSLDGAPVADTLHPSSPAPDAAVRALVAHAAETDRAAAIVVIDGRPYQMVVVPVLAPLPIAWICVGFLVDDSVARDLKALTNLHVSFVARRADHGVDLLGSTLPAATRPALLDAFPSLPASGPSGVSVKTPAGELVTLVTPLGGAPEAPVVALLQRSLPEALAPFRRLQLTLLGFAVGSLIVSAVAGLTIARRVTRPVSTLATAAGRVERGDYGELVQVDQDDELGQLATTFNGMMTGLAERDRVRAELDRVGRLKRFLSPQLAELVVSSGDEAILRSHRREITVVFCDLRGFTAFSEVSEPEEVMSVLDEYHAALGPLIFELEGTLERFTGDGMMVFFNDPVPCPDPSARAVKLALAMRDRVSDLSGRWRRRGHALGFGVGVAMGFATLGRIGFEGRFDYAAIGTVSNLASRLCDLAKDGEILVSQRVYTDVQDLVEAIPLPPATLKGFARPIAVFSIVGLRTSAPIAAG